MPLCSNSKNCAHDRLRGTQTPGGTSATPRCIRVGLINNMPDAALEATERQFRALLASASDGVTVRLSLYSLPDVPRAEAGKRHISDSYSSVEDLWDSQLDGLIVTGAEPRTADLKDEPYWESLSRVLEWARDHTHSTVFSCLAAHAAVLQMDGIGRSKGDDKHFGVFESGRVSDHHLIAGTPRRFTFPHSRWNSISEDQLAANGYSILMRSPTVGADIFVKQFKSLFVFFQGHPEYEADTLLREYRRDVGRYLRGEAKTYPSLPQSYFDEDTNQALSALHRQVISQRSEDLLTYVSTTLEHGTIANTWHSTAASIYRNWLQYIRDQKEAEAGLKAANTVLDASETNVVMLRPELTQIESMA
jgi:homoserine O-succinyltransferase/O-acetyltransferase